MQAPNAWCFRSRDSLVVCALVKTRAARAWLMACVGSPGEKRGELGRSYDIVSVSSQTLGNMTAAPTFGDTRHLDEREETTENESFIRSRARLTAASPNAGYETDVASQRATWRVGRCPA
jgi:hypothetical protein